MFENPYEPDAAGSVRRPRPAAQGLAAGTAVPAEDLLDAPPATEVIAGLVDLDMGALDDIDLLRVVAAWDRVGAWVAAQQARVVTELAHREPPRLAPDSFVADAIASELRVSRRSAQALVDRAWGLEAAPAVQDALVTGLVSPAKADAILRGTEHLPAGLAADVQADALLAAGRRTVPQLKECIRRAEQARAPEHAARRHERARAERGVWLRPTTDAMAWVNALLPATDAMRVMTAVDALATSSAPEDPRSADARRADALADLAGTVLDRGTDLDGAPLPTRQGRRPHLQVTITLPALCGASEAPAYLAGFGPVPAALARAIAADATWTFLAVDPRTGQAVDRSVGSYRPNAAIARAVVDRDVTCTFPGCRVPAQRCDLDHMVPFDARRPAAEQTTTRNLAALCRHHHRLKTHGRWTPSHDPTTGVTSWRGPHGATYTRDPAPVPFEQEPMPAPYRPRTVDARARPAPAHPTEVRTTSHRGTHLGTQPDAGPPF